MKKVEELEKRIDSIETKVAGMNTTIPTEQLAYNEELYSFIAELTDYENAIKEVINNKIKGIVKKSDSSIEQIEKETEDLKQILFCECSENKYLRETGLDKILYKISYSKDVDIVNKNIKEYINKLKKYGIDIEAEEHDYSYYTKKYMKKFYDNMSSGEFYIIMKKYFEEIYWICPNIIKQLVLNFLNILDKNKKNIHKKVIENRNELIKKNNFENENLNDLFFVKLNELYYRKNKDTFYIYDYFYNNTDILKKMSMYKYDELIKKYSSKAIEEDASEEVFIDNISSLHSNLMEYIVLMKYKYVLDYEKDILINKEKLDKTSKREIAKLTRKMSSYNKKIIKLNIKKEKNKNNGNNDETVDKKIRINNAYLTNIIDELYKLIVKDFITSFNTDITTKLTENSNIEEALFTASNNYLALSNIIYEKSMEVDICDEIDELEDFLQTRNLFISRNTSLNFFDNITSLINKKYVLCNINTDFDYTNFSSINDIIDELYFMILSYNLKQKNLTLKDIEICVRRAN